MKIIILINLIALCVVNNGVTSQDTLSTAIKDASRQYNVSPRILTRIAYIESKYNNTATRINKNGTTDYGAFQINSVHWNKTCLMYNIKRMKGNALCAAKILMLASKHKSKDKYWVGRYHSKTPKLKVKYAKLVGL